MFLNGGTQASSIVDELENQGNDFRRTFRCCIHDRDWIPGRPIGESIADSVNSSHRTLILLSQNFLRSPYCQQEFG
jgi:hypothetical protein